MRQQPGAGVSAEEGRTASLEGGQPGFVLRPVVAADIVPEFAWFQTLLGRVGAHFPRVLGIRQHIAVVNPGDFDILRLNFSRSPSLSLRTASWTRGLGGSPTAASSCCNSLESSCAPKRRSKISAQPNRLCEANITLRRVGSPGTIDRISGY